MKFKTKLRISCSILLSFAITALSCVSMPAIVVSQETQVYLNEDFNDPTDFPIGSAPDFADWGTGAVKSNKWKSTGNVTVKTEDSRRVAEVSGQVDPAYLTLDFKDEPLSGIIEIEAVINLKSRAAAGSPCLLEVYDTTGTTKLLSLNSNNNSNIQINNGSWTSVLTSNVVGTFHTYVVRIDTVTKSHELWIDGVSKGTHSLRNAASFNGSIGMISLYGEGTASNGGIIQLDGIKVSKLPESRLRTPSGLTASDVTEKSLNLSWTAVDGVDGYYIYRDGTYIAYTAAASYSDTNLKKDTQYNYTVAANKGFDLSLPSDAILVKTLYAAGGTVVADESFDKYPIAAFNTLAPWTVTKAGTGTAEIAGVPSAADRSLLLTVANNNNNDKAEGVITFAPITGSKKVIIEMDIRLEGSGNKFACAPYINDAAGNPILKFGFRDGYFSAFNNPSNTAKTQDIMKYESGRWYNVKIVFHTDINFYSIFIDGVRMDNVNGYDVRLPDTAIAGVQFKNDSSAAGSADYVNNLRISTAPIAPVTGVEFGKTSYTVYKNEKLTPTVNLIDENGDKFTATKDLSFTSNAPLVVQVNPTTGEMTALSLGNAEITVTTFADGKNRIATVPVAAVDSTYLPVPANLAATIVRNYSVELSWDDMGEDISKYYIYRSDSASGPFEYIGASKPEATRIDSATHYIDNNVQPDTTYYYKAVSTKKTGETVFESGFSNALSVKTKPKSQLEAAKAYTVRDDFNSDEMDSAPRGYTTSGVAIVKEIPFPEDKSVRVEAGAKAYKEITPVSGIVTIETKFKVSGTDNTRSVPTVYNSDGNMIARIRINGTDVEYLSGTAYTKANFTIERDVWYIVRVVINTDKKTYDVYIDGQKRVGNIAFPSGSGSANVAKLEYMSTLNALYFDNVKLYTQNDYIGAPTGSVINVKDHGAVGNGTHNDRDAIQKAINLCPAGGTVLLEGGTFYSGSIVLKSNMTLYINHDAVLLGSSNVNDYPYYDPMTYNTQLGPTHNCSRAFIYAENVENVKIDGGGTINGNGKTNFTENVRGVSHEPHRPILIYIAMSNTVTIQNIYIKDSAMWTVVPAESDYVTVRNIWEDVRANANRDGIDITDCKNVLVEDCTVTTADDSICIKSGKRRGVDNLLVQNCYITVSWTNGLKFGTASYGAFKNCDFKDIMIKNVKYSPMCVESVDGADIENVNFQRIDFRDVANPFWIILGQRSLRGTGDDGGKVGTLKNVTFKDIIGTGLHNRIDNYYDADSSPISGTTVTGEDGIVYNYRLKDLYFENVNITYKGGRTGSVPPTPAEYKLGQYPESSIWGILPAYGYFIRHADNVIFKNCTTSVENTDVRYPFIWSDSNGRRIFSVDFDSNGGSAVDGRDVDYGQKITKPADPIKPGFKFDGWYTDMNLTTAWNFSTGMIMAKTTLYAKWVASVEPTTDPTPDVKIGDVDGDGEIRLKDATLVQKHLAKLLTLSASQSAAADIDKDGKIMLKDVTLIQKHLAKLIDITKM